MVKLPTECVSSASWWGTYNGRIVYVNGVHNMGKATYPDGSVSKHGQGRDDNHTRLYNDFNDRERPRYLGIHDSFRNAVALPKTQRPLVAVLVASSFNQNEYELLGFYKVNWIETTPLQGTETAVYTHFERA